MPISYSNICSNSFSKKSLKVNQTHFSLAEPISKKMPLKRFSQTDLVLLFLFSRCDDFCQTLSSQECQSREVVMRVGYPLCCVNQQSWPEFFFDSTVCVSLNTRIFCFEGPNLSNKSQCAKISHCAAISDGKTYKSSLTVFLNIHSFQSLPLVTTRIKIV